MPLEATLAEKQNQLDIEAQSRKAQQRQTSTI
jgi:hypothetical protein